MRRHTLALPFVLAAIVLGAGATPDAAATTTQNGVLRRRWRGAVERQGGLGRHV